MRQPQIFVLVLASIFLTGCASMQGGESRGFGGGIIAPSVSSSALDSSLVAQSGFNLSRSELRAAVRAEQRALESTPAGQGVQWSGDRNGRAGTVTAAQPYRVGSQDCRPFSHVINVDGQNRALRGTACRSADGSWAVLN